MDYTMDFTACVDRRAHEVTLSSDIPRPPRMVYNTYSDSSSEHCDSSQNYMDDEPDPDVIRESLKMIRLTTTAEEHIGMPDYPKLKEQLERSETYQLVPKPFSIKTDINSNVTTADSKLKSEPLQSTLNVHCPEFVPRKYLMDEPVPTLLDWRQTVLPSPAMRPPAWMSLEEPTLPIEQSHVELPLVQLPLDKPSRDKPPLAEPPLVDLPFFELPIDEPPAAIPPIDKMLLLEAQLQVQTFFEPISEDKKMRNIAMESLMKKEEADKPKLKLLTPEYFQAPSSAGPPPQIKLELKSQLKPETKAKLESESKKQPKPAPMLESKMQSKQPESKSLSGLQSKTECTPWSKTEGTTRPKRDGTTRPKRDGTMQPKRDGTTRPKRDGTTRPKRDASFKSDAFKSDAKPIEHPIHIQMHSKEKVNKWLNDINKENKEEYKRDTAILENSHFAVSNVPKSSHSSLSNVEAPAAAKVLVKKSTAIKDYKPSGNFHSLLAKINQNRKPAEEQQVLSKESSLSAPTDTLNDLIENAIKIKEMKTKKVESWRDGR